MTHAEDGGRHGIHCFGSPCRPREARSQTGPTWLVRQDVLRWRLPHHYNLVGTRISGTYTLRWSEWSTAGYYMVNGKPDILKETTKVALLMLADAAWSDKISTAAREHSTDGFRWQHFGLVQSTPGAKAKASPMT